MLSLVEQTLFFLSILLLPTQLGKHFWPTSSQVFSLRIDYLSPTIYFWDFISLSLFVCFLIQKQRLNKKALTVGLFFLLTQALSIFYSGNLETGLVRFYSFLPPLVFGLYVASKDRAELFSNLLPPLVFSVLLEGALGITQFLTGKSVGLWLLGERSFSVSTPFIATFNFLGKVFLRPYASFPHPNVFACFNFVALILLLTYRKKHLTPFFRRLYRLALIIGGLALLLSFSRSAIIVAVVSLLFIGRDKIKKLLTLGEFKKAVFGQELIGRQGLALLLVVALGLLPLLVIRFSALVDFDQISLLRRQELAEASLRLWRKDILFGVGLNNFIPNLAFSNLISGEGRFLQPVHSIYLLVLSETGLVGVAGLLPLMALPFFGKDKSALSRVLLVGWVGLLFLGLFDHYLLTLPQGQRLLFLLFGLLV